MEYRFLGEHFPKDTAKEDEEKRVGQRERGSCSVFARETSVPLTEWEP